MSGMTLTSKRSCTQYPIVLSPHSMFGDPHVLVLHYFLANDTIEVIEKVAPNSGRDAFPVFLQRQKLPKQIENLKQPGVETKRTVLNVFGPMGHGGRHILDSLKVSVIFHSEVLMMCS